MYVCVCVRFYMKIILFGFWGTIPSPENLCCGCKECLCPLHFHITRCVFFYSFCLL